MGVPAFFRWLQKKYPAIVVNAQEEKQRTIDGTIYPIDATKPNPNNVEFDNLYLDMNGIIHPCTHPEDKPAPRNEDEMMVAIFEYMDRLFNIIRPRRLLYMAIDGVAPRAKMNQQRSRRFRASKDTEEKNVTIADIRAELESKGADLPPMKDPSSHFDSNCITPGTPFMLRLADCLRFYVHERQNTDPAWKDIKVILSDASAPGEGEHKIMDYIRRQRAQPDHDPDTHHCLCGADADLIMLGLATHEPHFTIIREEFKPNQPRPCELCGQFGHELNECQGLARDKADEDNNMVHASEQSFIFIRLNILREYLERELTMEGLPFTWNLERVIDDWVFMCFFVGNDFLPHLPSLEIREGAIDRLVNLYKKVLPQAGGYMSENGHVNMERCQRVLTELGKAEDVIFKNRRDDDLKWKRIQADRKNRQSGNWRGRGGRGGGRGAAPQPVLPLTPLGASFRPATSSPPGSADRSDANKEAAAKLKAQFSGASGSSPATAERSGNGEAIGSHLLKRKHPDAQPEDANDEVRLWEDGFRERYYASKFQVETNCHIFGSHVGREYARGLCWVLLYYYQGCPSWKWFFPFHYAPFASDMVDIAKMDINFEKSEPFKPLEQLMGVFPAASRKFVPPTWQRLMVDPESPIIDQYPIDFKIDLNGKKWAWMGVALLPFVEETRLWKALERVYGDLTPEELKRNARGADVLFVNKSSPTYSFLTSLYSGAFPPDKKIELDPALTGGIRGTVWCDKKAALEGETIHSPLEALDPMPNNQVVCCNYLDPQYGENYTFDAKLLPAVTMPVKTLKAGDWRPDSNNQQRGGPGYRYQPYVGFQNPNERQHATSVPLQRAIRHYTPSNRGVRAPMGPGAAIPPPNWSGPRGPPQQRGGWGGQQPQRGGYGNAQSPQRGGYGGQQQGYGGGQGGHGQRGGFGGAPQAQGGGWQVAGRGGGHQPYNPRQQNRR